MGSFYLWAKKYYVGVSTKRLTLRVMQMVINRMA